MGVVSPANSPYYQNGNILVLNTHIVQDKNFGFMEFGNIEMTTAVLQLDGMEYVCPDGSRVNWRIKRPNDYKVCVSLALVGRRGNSICRMDMHIS
jgi:hypothetical protein